MLANGIHYLARRERYTDLLKQAAHERLARASMHQQATNRKIGITAIHWIGAHMIKWGCTLQQCDTVMPCCSQATSRG